MFFRFKKKLKNHVVIEMRRKNEDFDKKCNRIIYDYTLSVFQSSK